MRIGCLIALCAFCACNKKATPDAAGTVRLMITSDTPLKTINVIAYAKNATSKIVKGINVSKYDLSKNPVEEDIDTSPDFPSGVTLFVAIGYDGGNTQVAEGTVQGAFAPGAFTTLDVKMLRGVDDADQDGDPSETDCNDNDSSESHFFSEQCGDDKDNDCSGSVNDGCPCSSGPPVSCYNFYPPTRGLGQCHDGTQTCTGGILSTCAGAVGPDAVETCDNIDNTCDGSVDEGCTCQAGSQRYCNNNSVTTASQDASSLNLQGQCQAGIQPCNDSVWGTCAGAVVATAELCNGLDDDCDGVYDNGFDADGDGYTTCGTAHAACDQNATAPAKVIGGLSAQFIDCDDADPTRHPCQNNLCDGDPIVDRNCGGTLDICGVSTTSCQTFGYYGGLDETNVIGAGHPVCYFSGVSSGSTCDTTDHHSCDADGNGCNSVGSQGAVDTSFSRSVCNEVFGCDAGSMTGPTQAPVAAHSDPHNDCGTVNCDATHVVYAGWVYVDADGAYECQRFDGISVKANCIAGAGNCETFAGACPLAGAKTVVAGSPKLAACMTSVGDSTCTGTIAPDAGVSINAGPDDQQRCPFTGCNGIVTSSGWQAAGCTIFSTASAAQVNCASGACEYDQTSCASATPVIAQCDAACQIATACQAGSRLGADYCYNINGGDVGGSCAAGLTCYSGTPGGNQNASCSQACNSDLACGSSCANCTKTTGAACCSGFDDTGTCVTAGTASSSSCACTAKTGNSVAFLCGSACCSVGQYCNGTCMPPGASNFACGGANPPRKTNWCDVSTSTPTMTSVAAPTKGSASPCNQALCTSSEYCSDYASSQCSSCGGGEACWTSCCTGTQTCTVTATGGTCT